jgi:hypothetical protein
MIMFDSDVKLIMLETTRLSFIPHLEISLFINASVNILWFFAFVGSRQITRDHFFKKALNLELLLNK